MRFVCLTKLNSQEVFINLELVTEISRNPDKNETFIFISRPGSDGEGDYTTVQETPEQILTAKPAF